MVGPRNILLALAVVAAIAIGSENAAEEQEDHLDALELCLDPFPCRTSPHISNKWGVPLAVLRPRAGLSIACVPAEWYQRGFRSPPPAGPGRRPGRLFLATKLRPFPLNLFYIYSVQL